MGALAKLGISIFLVFLAKTLPFWRTTIGTLARTPKIGNMYSEEIMLQVAHICIFCIFSFSNVITWKHPRTLYFIHKIPKYCSYQLFWKVDSIWNLYWSQIKANRGQAVSRHLRSHVQLSTQTHRKRRFTKADRKHTWPKKKGQILDNFLVFGLLRSQIRIDIMQFWHLDLWRRTKLIPNVLEL